LLFETIMSGTSFTALQNMLDTAVAQYNTPDFIPNDPISIPHRFSKRQDIEIAGLLAATLAWGNRKMIIRNVNRLMNWMDEAPYDFIRQHQERDLKRFEGFAHRTFNTTDLLHFIQFLRHHFETHDSLEDLFLNSELIEDEAVVARGLVQFRKAFFALEHAPARTQKHVASPERGSACKRLNMFLRWMVRQDTGGVDFGLWKRLKPSQLIAPLDIHSGRTARQLGLLTRKQDDWKAAVELTEQLRTFCPEDPVKYDFALFSISVGNGKA
jgi:uncharacterized protein (TIGR02757 family)